MGRWAEKELNMMHHFFADLVHFSEAHREKAGAASAHLYVNLLSSRCLAVVWAVLCHRSAMIGDVGVVATDLR